MRAPVVGLLISASAGCLEPARPTLEALDVTAPRVLSTRPTDGGSLRKDDALEVTFSEELDPTSLRLGLRLESTSHASLPLLFHSPELMEGKGDQDSPWVVTAWSAGNPLQAGVLHSLVAGTSLLDAQGNALVEEVRVQFMVVP